MINRALVTYAVVAAAVIAVIWAMPSVGVVAGVVALAVIPPWGRGLIERAAISAIVVLGIVSLVFPREGAMPVTPESARLTLTALLIATVALRIVPRLRDVPLPRVGVSDIAIVAVAVIGWIWLTGAYWNVTPEQMISGLFFSGWDNQGHLLPFANTYMQQSTTWATIDGTIAWNQWYPALHSTIWALGELAVNGAGASRVELLWPYVTWNAISFVASFAALAYVAGDLAARIVSTNKTWARFLAVGAVALFGLLGSPALLYNAGFTNFVMGVALVVAATYLSARSIRSARTLGWFLIPAAGVAALGLWTPLILALVPAGIVVLIALWRAPQFAPMTRRILTVIWVVASATVIGFIALDQSQAILAVDGESTAGEFTEEIGRVGVGMIPFNTGIALISPVLAILAAIVVRRRGVPMMVAVATPTLATGILAWVFATGADANGVPRLQSYYVLKALDGMLLMIAPVLAALIAAVIVRALATTSAVTKVAGSVMAGLVGLMAFGYVGVHPEQPWDSFTAAPGVQAGNIRATSVQDSLIGVAVLAGVEGANTAPDFTPMLWDGSGHLPNLWVRTLTGVLSSQEASFYGGLPPFPYEAKTLDYITLTLNLKPTLDLALVFFRPPSGELLTEAQTQWPSGRTEVVGVAMQENPLCVECPPRD